MSAIEVYRKKCKPAWKSAFLSAFLMGFLVHAYKLMNPLMNHDSLYNFYSDQNSVGLGRWFLTIACGISSYFDLPWVNGLLSIVYIALTAVVITELFEIKNPIVIVLSGGLLSAFPAVTETLFFGFTADGYMLGMLLSAMAILFLRIDERRASFTVIGGILICLGCAVYQANVSFALVLLIAYLMKDILEDRHDAGTYYLYCMKQICVFAAALAGYYLIWKICLHAQGKTAGTLHGIDEVADLGSFSISFSWFVQAMIGIIRTILFMLLEWNIFEHGITLYAMLNIVFVIFLAATLVVAVKESGLLQRLWQLGLYVLCIAALPFAIGLWHLASDSIGYRPMMLESMSIVYILLAVLCEHWMGKRWNRIVTVLLAVIVVNFGVMANIAYDYMEKSQIRSLAMGTEMMSRIHMLASEDEYEYIAIVGKRNEEVQLGIEEPSAHIHMLAHQLETDLLIDRVHAEMYLTGILGVDKALFSVPDYEELAQSTTVQEMPSWPDRNSMRLIGDTVVIKIGK